MATLTNTKIKDTYDGLLKTTNNEAIAASGVTLIEDGLGNASALSVGRSGNGVTITGSLNATLATAAQPNITSVGTLSSLAVSGNLAVDTNTLYVDASSNEVGIGTNSPLAKTHIKSGTSGFSGTLNANYDDLAIEGGGNTGITILTPNNNNGGIAFSDEDAEVRGLILYGHADDFMSFNTGGSEAMRIDSSGNVGIGITPDGAKLDILGNLRVRRDVASTQYTEILSGGGESRIIAKNNAAASFQALIFESGNNTTTTERMRITSDGDVLFGTQGTPNGTSVYGSAFTPDASDTMTLRLATSTAGAKNLVAFYNPNGNVGKIQVSGTATSYITSSDYRLKENVVDMTGALDRVDALKPSRFNFIADAETTVDGFLAHEVAEVVPEAISGEKDAVDEEGNPVYQGIDQSKLVPLLVGAIKELSAKVAALESQLNA